MSGYIKVRKDLVDDPRVIDLAEGLGDALHCDASCDASRYALLGVTVTLWCYADTHIRDDDTLPIRIGALARMLRFPESLLRKLPPEWLVVRDDGSVYLPGYREKNGLISREKRKEATKERTRKWREARAEKYANGDASRTLLRTQSVMVASPSPSPSPNHKSQKKVPTEPVPQERDREAVDRVFDHWKSVHAHPRAKIDDKRRRVIRAALTSYSADDLCESISGYLNSPHHMGVNDRGTRYDDIELFLRDAKHIDAGLAFARDPPANVSTLTRKIVANTQDWQPPEVRRAAV